MSFSYNFQFANNTFISFYGYDFAELSETSFFKSELSFKYALSDNNYVTFIANYGRLDGNVFKNMDDFTDIKSGYAFGYSYNSLIGPVEIKYSWSPDTNKNYLLFNLGFWF